MLPFLQSNVTLVFAAILALVLIGIRAASTDRDFRRDLRGALVLLVLSLFLRTIDALLSHALTPNADKALQVAWMLTFAFGCIRAGVSVALFAARFRSSVPTPKILRDVVDFSLYALAAIPILKSQLEIDLASLVATSAILSVVIGLALQDTLGNLFAGLAIQVERPFQVGDFVTVAGHSGRIVQIAWRAIRLETFRHEVITIPNNVLSKEAVKNFSRGAEPVGMDLYIGVSYSAPPNQVKDAVLSVLKEIPLVLPDPRPKCRTWAYDADAIRYQIRYFVADFLSSETAMEEIYTRLWYRFRREGLNIPFPQRTVHLVKESAAREVTEEAVADLLDSVDLLAVIPAENRRDLARDILPRRFGRGERIIEHGTPGHTFYIVASGEISIRTGKPEVEIARLRRGQYFGEMSLLTGEPRAASVVATSDALLLEVDRPMFARLFSENVNLAHQLSAVLAQRRTSLRQANEVAGGAPLDHAPEANRIFTRLRSIFGLSD